MAVSNQITGMSLEDFMRLWAEEGPFELIDGERIPVMAQVFGASNIANNLAFALNAYCIPKEIGKAFTETTFVLVPFGTPNWVKGSRIPDVMFIRAKILAEYKTEHPDWEIYPLALVPDLAVEIVSNEDDYLVVMKKVRSYLADGVQVVWLIEPPERIVNVYSANNPKHPIVMTNEDKLSGGDVIPGFEISVKDIFV
jgi:Uma2 family endonuclease